MRVIVSENLFKIIEYYNGEPDGNINACDSDIVIIENPFEFDEKDIEYMAKKAIDNKVILRILNDLKTKIQELNDEKGEKEKS